MTHILNEIFDLLITFFKIGALSIGGGYATIPLIKEQVVDIKCWLSAQEFTDIITISQMTPGPLAVNASTFTGIRIAGIGGAVAATLGCIATGFLVSLVLYRFFEKNKQSGLVSQILDCLKCASAGLIAAASASIFLISVFGCSSGALKEAFTPQASLNPTALILCAATLIILRVKKWNPTLLLLFCGLAGLFLYR